MRYLLLIAIPILLVDVVCAATPEEQHFAQKIAPLLAQRCLTCHIDGKRKGELDLSSRASAMKGGESGEVIVPGDLDDSLFWEQIAEDDMPPKHPLPAAEKELFRKWIASGAKWGAEDKIDFFAYTTPSRAGYDWWSLQPLAKIDSQKQGTIDAFIDARLKKADLKRAGEASKRVLIRRLSFDLLGLPPTPDQVDAFLKDTSPDAYEKLVDQFLASPHYGERWARHWLDVVRFGESNGFEYDQPRNNAWHYRNWVINALNQDMPYDEFVRMQLAGDVLHPGDPQAIAATGFLVAGAHNTTLPSSSKMRISMAQDEMEDTIGVIGQSFLGLTTNCGRCHEHKFDPVSQQDYYELAAALAGVKHGERTVKNVPTSVQQQRLKEIGLQLAAIDQLSDAIQQPVRAKIIAERKVGKSTGPLPPKAYATWEFDGDLKDRLGSLHAKANGGATIVDGFLKVDGKSAYANTPTIPIALGERTLEAWVQLDSLTQRGGGVISIQTTNGGVFDAIVFGEKEPKKWMAGSNAFTRYRPFGGKEETDATERPVHMAIVFKNDGTITAYRDGQPYGKPYRPGAMQRFAANTAQIVFGLRHGTPGANRMLAGRIQRAQLYDRALTAQEIAASAGVADSNYVPESQILARISDVDRKKIADLNAQTTQLTSEKNRIGNTESQKMYTCVSSNPGPTYLYRGMVADPKQIVSPSGLRAIPGIGGDFELSPKSSDADRRKKLASWITHRDNGVFSRVIVNRLWHYHFGLGLVDTPNDFGFNGSKPSHPELLDWLAQTLKKNDYRLKAIHRLIVTSATYRQSSTPNAVAAKIDASNRLLWRKSPQRLEAEAIRDAVVSVAGQLNPEIGGKGYRDVRHFQFKGSNFYEVLPETGVEKRRRTVYRFMPRGGRNPFLDTFDCPDPSATAPKRATTTTPLQALALMNNALVLQMSDLLAERVSREVGTNVDKQVAKVYQLAYGREADADEIESVLKFVEKHGLPAFCRVVFNSNEFVVVE